MLVKFLKIILTVILATACAPTTSSFSSSFRNPGPSQFVSSISRKDQNSLRLFIRDFVWWNQAPYVLLGDKPMALGCYGEAPPPIRTEFKAFLKWRSARRDEINAGFKVWKEHREFFSSPKYLMLCEPWKDGIETVLLINKENFAKKIRESRPLFERAIGISDPEKIFEMMKTTPLLEGILKGRHDLLGVLLGFGEENAVLFQKFSNKHQQLGKEELREFYRDNHFVDIFTAEENKPWLDLFSKNPTWIGIYTKREVSFDPRLIAPPGFLCYRDSETSQKIKKEFISTRKKIIEVYTNKDPLEVTLELLWH